MGLGKTLQALGVACAYREDWPVLVVCPSSLRGVWKKEAEKWVPGLTPNNIQVEVELQHFGSSNFGLGSDPP